MKDYIKPIAEIVRFNTEAITDEPITDDVIGGESGVGSGGDDSWD